MNFLLHTPCFLLYVCLLHESESEVACRLSYGSFNASLYIPVFLYVCLCLGLCDCLCKCFCECLFITKSLFYKHEAAQKETHVESKGDALQISLTQFYKGLSEWPELTQQHIVLQTSLFIGIYTANLIQSLKIWCFKCDHEFRHFKKCLTHSNTHFYLSQRVTIGQSLILHICILFWREWF